MRVPSQSGILSVDEYKQVVRLFRASVAGSEQAIEAVVGCASSTRSLSKAVPNGHALRVSRSTAGAEEASAASGEGR